MVIQTAQQCACRWIFQHQHKLTQIAARSCSLKVKEALPGDDIRNDEYESEITFKYSDLTTTLAEPNQLRRKPDASELKFGHIFTDHMLKVFYHQALGGWQKPEIIPFENITLHPASKVLHYAIQLFEGMKAYRGIDGRIRIFRSELNMQRMNMSARESGLPSFEGLELMKCINRLITIDQEWTPHSEASSLYIRPTFIGIDGTLGVAKSDSALLYAILCPVGEYFADGNDSVSLLADPSYTRAWPGGSGASKVGSNYGPTIRVQQQATLRGRQQVLWLYGDHHDVTEVGTMNIFAFYVNERGQKELATPPLNGLILPGITRLSILELARQWGEFNVVERSFTMPDVIKLHKEQRLLEMFGSGTACIVSPISSIDYLGTEYLIPTNEHAQPFYKRVRQHLLEIQYGHIKHPWAQTIDISQH